MSAIRQFTQELVEMTINEIQRLLNEMRTSEAQSKITRKRMQQQYKYAAHAHQKGMQLRNQNMVRISQRTKRK